MVEKGRDVAPQDGARAKIAKYLPDAIERAIQSYREFYAQETATDAKAFSAHHSACKAAIAHIELLLKLAAWAHLPSGDDDDGLADMIAQAQGTLMTYQEDADE